MLPARFATGKLLDVLVTAFRGHILLVTGDERRDG